MPIRVQFWYSEHVIYFCKQTDNVLRGMDLERNWKLFLSRKSHDYYMFFFSNIVVLFYYIFMILIWNIEKIKSLRFFQKKSKHFQFLESAILHILCYNLFERWSRILKKSQKYSKSIPLKVSHSGNCRRLGDISKDIRGKWLLLGVHVRWSKHLGISRAKWIKSRPEWQRPAWSCRTTGLHCCVDYHVRAASVGQDWRHLDGCSTSRRHFLGGWTSLALPYPGRSRICNVRSLPGCCDLWDLEKQWIDAQNECQIWTSEAGKGFKCIQILYWSNFFYKKPRVRLWENEPHSKWPFLISSTLYLNLYKTLVCS